MKLKKLYEEIIKKGIQTDIRGPEAIGGLLRKRKEYYEGLKGARKDFYDQDAFFNPYADTRILNGKQDSQINSVIVGIDVEVQELLLVDRMRAAGKKIDLAIAHHPEGRAYAGFYDVMDLQADVFNQRGISLSVCESLLEERKNQVARRVSAANHARSVDAARLLGINFLCMHTPCDNCAYDFLNAKIKKEKPGSLGRVIDMLMDIPEYRHAAEANNPPSIIIGGKESRCSNMHLEFTGGTEGPMDIYDNLAARGIDTIIAMHQSEEHYKKCKQARINVIFASHIASDNIGVNIVLDHLEYVSGRRFITHEFSGFKRFRRDSKPPKKRAS